MKQVTVPLYDFGHFDKPCVLWEALKQGIVKPGQMLGIHLVGCSHPDHVASLTFDVKPFDTYDEFEDDPEVTEEWEWATE